ncbi:hypothetical protein BC940DRAFT_307066 [Gongronella butleri]|nr:hypothetical protein BC940DRAFT_307066 [Gongronella butleri]
MLVQDLPMSQQQPLHAMNTPRQLPLRRFLKAAMDVLFQHRPPPSSPTPSAAHATTTATTPMRVVAKPHDDDDDSDGDVPIVTWKLNLSATLMTLDTNIQTLAGLEQVLDQLGNDLQHNDHPDASIRTKNDTHHVQLSHTSTHRPTYRAPSLTNAIAQVLSLSRVTMVPAAADMSPVVTVCNSVQLIKQCVQLFVMCEGALFVDIPHLLTVTEQLLASTQQQQMQQKQQQQQQQPQQQQQQHQPAPQDALLVYSICALMVPHVFVHRHNDRHLGQALSHCYATRAKHLLRELFDVPHLSVLQAMFLLSVHPQSHVHLWSTSRIDTPMLLDALRLATSMRMHCLDMPSHDEDENDETDNDSHDLDEMNSDKSRLKHESAVSTAPRPYHAQLTPDEIERRRRLMWMLFCADHFAHDNASGKTGVLQVAHWHVDFPQVLPGDKQPRQVAYFSQYCRVVMIRKMQLFQSAYAIVLRSAQALAGAVDESIFNKYLATPAELRVNHNVPLDKGQLEPLLLDTLHCHTLMEALVPFLPARYLHTLDQAKSMRLATIHDIYNHADVQFSRLKHQPPAPHPESQQQLQQLQQQQQLASLLALFKYAPLPLKRDDDTIVNNGDDGHDRGDENREMHTVISCLVWADRYTSHLEKLAQIDAFYCRHQPGHALLLTAMVYDTVQINGQHYDVTMVCRANLVRSLRIVQRARQVNNHDMLLMYLERMLHNCVASTAVMDESVESLATKTAALLTALRQSTLYHPVATPTSTSASASVSASVEDSPMHPH